MKWKKRIAVIVSPKTILLFVGVAVLSLLAVLFLPQNDAYAIADREIGERTDVDYQKYFTEHIDVFFKEEGINGMIQRVIKALAEEQITMFVCHSLAHDIGHYGGYPDNFTSIESYLSKENLDFCGSGFMHGVEAQLANEAYPQNVEALHYFCTLVIPKNPYYHGCYHGAGHSFMERTHDTKEALAQCDLLLTDELVPDPSNCYRGVFSENANYMRTQGNNNRDLLLFCNSLEHDLQKYCAEELNGLEMPRTATEYEIALALEECLQSEYAYLIQAGCVRSVAGVATDHILGQEGRELHLSPVILMLASDMQHVYMTSVYGALIKSAPYRDISFETFCEGFSEKEKESCLSLPQDFIEADSHTDVH